MLFDWLHPLTAYRMLDDLVPNRTARSGVGPLINLYRDEETARVDLRVPGYEPQDIEISVENASLRVTGAIKPIEREGQIVRREREPHKFDRRIRLPFRVDESQVQATYRNGYLSVALNMHASEKPRVIPVKTI
jgi:HSP20 family protein